MADRRMSSNEMASHAIAPRQWNAFLAEFTEYNRGAHGQVEILGGEISRLVETGNRPFIGISADTKDGETHCVDRVRNGENRSLDARHSTRDRDHVPAARGTGRSRVGNRRRGRHEDAC